MNTILKYSIVLLYDHGSLVYAIAMQLNEDKYQIYGLDNREQILCKSRICLQSKEHFDIFPSVQLTIFMQAVENIISNTSVNSVEDLVGQAGSYPTWQDIQSYAHWQSDEERFAFFWILKTRKDLFRWKEEKVHILSSSERQQIADKIYVYNKRKEQLDEYHKLILEAIQNPKPYADLPISLLTEQLCNEIREYLLYGSYDDLGSLVKSTIGTSEILGALKRIRYFYKDLTDATDPIIASSGLPVTFSKALDLNLNDPPTNLPKYSAFSIDEADSLDFDDAISLTKDDDGYTLGIHISSVASRVPLDSSLFHEARNRVSTVYLCTETIPMFPFDLSTDQLSLIKGMDRVCTSLIITLNQDYQIISSRLEECVVNVTQNYSYREIDRLMHQSPFKELRIISKILIQDRGKDDPDINMPNRLFYIKSDKEKLYFQRIDLDSPSRKIIEELMILYNSYFAQYASDNRIPLIFRNIVQFNHDESGYQSQAYLSTSAEYHPGIGSTAYVHASSPIRRFTDLLNQYQMLHYLRCKQCYFDSTALESHIPSIQERLNLQKELIAKSERYWVLKYLEFNHLHSPLSVYVLRQNKTGILVELINWGKKVLIKCNTRVNPGDEFDLVIDKVDVDKGLIYGELM